MRKIVGICKICGKPRWAKDLCRTHYETHRARIYRANHPEYVQRGKERTKLYRRKLRENPAIKDKFRLECKEWRKKLRHEVLSHYSSGQFKCVKCGYSDMRALCLDHTNNDGAQHRKSLNPNENGRHGNAVGVYLDLKRRGFPEGYQILCHNCNRIKEVERYEQFTIYSM